MWKDNNTSEKMAIIIVILTIVLCFAYIFADQIVTLFK